MKLMLPCPHPSATHVCTPLPPYMLVSECKALPHWLHELSVPLDCHMVVAPPEHTFFQLRLPPLVDTAMLLSAADERVCLGEPLSWDMFILATPLTWLSRLGTPPSHRRHMGPFPLDALAGHRQ